MTVSLQKLINNSTIIISQECCKFPDFFEEKDIKETYKKVVDGNLAQPATPLFDCVSIYSCYLKNLTNFKFV